MVAVCVCAGARVDTRIWSGVRGQYRTDSARRNACLFPVPRHWPKSSRADGARWVKGSEGVPYGDWFAGLAGGAKGGGFEVDPFYGVGGGHYARIVVAVSEGKGVA